MDLALTLEDARPFRLTVDQYRDLIEASVIEEGARVELIEGLIVEMNAQASVHAVVTWRLATRLADALQALRSPLWALATPTVAIHPDSALDPDVAILEPMELSRDFFPVSGVHLLVEVSLTTLRKDLKVKRDIYAAAGVPEYWVVDVKKAEVHRFADPRDGVYRAEPPVLLAGELRSLAMPELVIDGGGIL